jgi:hypothetical protein
MENSILFLFFSFSTVLGLMKIITKSNETLGSCYFYICSILKEISFGFYYFEIAMMFRNLMFLNSAVLTYYMG